MSKSRLSVFLILTMSFLISKGIALPKIIDFGKFLPIADPRRAHDELQCELGCYDDSFAK